MNPWARDQSVWGVGLVSSPQFLRRIIILTYQLDKDKSRRLDTGSSAFFCFQTYKVFGNFIGLIFLVSSCFYGTGSPNKSLIFT